VKAVARIRRYAAQARAFVARWLRLEPRISADLVDALEAEIRDYLLDAMAPDSSGELAQMTLADLHITYLNWRGRFISQRPRKVHTSQEIDAAHLGQHQATFDSIVKAIEHGDDLTRHLSTRVTTAYVPSVVAATQKMHQQRDRDLLIADWGIHHLHLSTQLRSDGFVERSGDLLFAYFAEDDAYLINIYPHQQWTKKEMLEICIRNWPAAGIVTPLQGLVGLSQQFTESEHQELRNAGVAQLLEIDGSVYAPAGQTTAGTPMVATLAANQTQWYLQSLRKIPDLAASLKEQAPSSGRGQWEPHVQNDDFGFLRGGVFACLGRLA
jgi:hypothetical protein